MAEYSPMMQHYLATKAEYKGGKPAEGTFCVPGGADAVLLVPS